MYIIRDFETDNNIGKSDKCANFSTFDLSTALWSVCAIKESRSYLKDMKIVH